MFNRFRQVILQKDTRIINNNKQFIKFINISYIFSISSL